MEGTGIRLPLFDVTKALMMLWVIWGHLGLYGIVSIPEGNYPHLLNAKIGVNMPVFFVISGYFAASTFAKGSWSKVAARAVGFLWPQTALAACVAAVGLLLAMNFGEAVEYLLSIWFLRTMLVVYLLAALAYKSFKSDALRWMAMIGIYALMVFLPVGLKSFWIGKSAHMFPYFVFGLMVLRKHELHKKTWVSLSCGLFFLAVVLMEGNSPTVGMSFWNGATHWTDLISSAYNSVTFFARTAVGISGSVFVLYVIERLLRILPQMSVIGALGTTTMGVYVLHEVILIKAGETLSFLPFPFWTRWPVAIAYLIVCHFVIVVVKRCKATRFLFFGDEKHMESVFSFLPKFDKGRDSAFCRQND